MEVRYAPNQAAYLRMTTKELRGAFVFEELFVPHAIAMVYNDIDRAIIGGAVPIREPLRLQASMKEMAAEYFAERREVGVINTGGTGRIRADGKDHALQVKDVLFIGKGVKEIEFASSDPENPAQFYFVSYPAHAAYPTTRATFAEAEPVRLGSQKEANTRTIYKYIHPGGIKSSQLVMGMTELEEGSVWNTMPAHTHQRRSEVYLYFNVDADSFVVHMMGRPDEARALILRNRQAVISPSWSIHCGSGTRRYSFVWAMGGENQEFSDMDPVPMNELL